MDAGRQQAPRSRNREDRAVSYSVKHFLEEASP